MNLLQSFMGCMYPGSIRTESIESMDHDHPDCRFQAANLDEHDNEVTRGELQLTDKDLIYFRTSKFPVRWPIGCIRRYGYSQPKNKFVFEAGRRCPTGEAVYAFRVSQGADLVKRLAENMEKNPSNEVSNEQDNQHDDILSTTDDQAINSEHQPNFPSNEDRMSADPRPLSYALIDFDTTKALCESAQAHAANRVK